MIPRIPDPTHYRLCYRADLWNHVFNLKTTPKLSFLVIHCQVLALIEQDLKRFQPTVDRIVVQIWDFVVDFEGIPIGLPQAVFPNNAVLQGSLERYVRYHLQAFHDVATKNYLKSSSCYPETVNKASALFLCSIDDPVRNKHDIQKLIDKWDSKGITVYLKYWESSSLVSHLHHYLEDYKQEMKAFPDKLGLLPNPEKFHQVILLQRQ